MIRWLIRGVSVVVISFVIIPVNSQASSDHADNLCRRTTGTVACYAKVISGPGGAPLVQSLPHGISPSQLRTVYGFSVSGSGKRVAIVGAYNDVVIKGDLDRYSQTYGLPVLPACTSHTQVACFERLNEHGGQTFGSPDAGWAVETALDVETVHGLCPGCRIELIQADTASMSHLMTAEDEAAVTGATIVSNSWGGSETKGEVGLDSHFGAPGVTYLAASGDSGYGVSYPAASSEVIAVGGTSLSVTTSGRRTSETAWSGSGSGCSRYEPKPRWQSDGGCVRRSIVDIAAVADPNTGVAVYSSSGGSGSGWFTVGGTSLATPIIAAGIAVGALPSQASTLAQHRLGLYDVTSGQNGVCPLPYLCKATVGYDGPTGWGVPKASS
jgi:subtilase family serine protease